MRPGNRTAHRSKARLGRREAVLAIAGLSAACASVSPLEAARLAHDGEAAAEHLMADTAAAERRVDGARDLLLLRTALTARPGTDPAALGERPDVSEADGRLARAAAVLAQGRSALEGLRNAYRAFANVAAGRDPETFDAMLDRAAEDAEALRTLIERYGSAEATDLVEGLPGGGAVLGVARLFGGVFSRVRTARNLVEPNDALIALLDELIEAADREAETLGPLLAQVAADRGEDVAAALRAAGVARIRQTSTLERLAEAYGWSVSPLADDRLRERRTGRLALGLRAIEARRAASQPARLLDPGAGRAVLVALRDRHIALRHRTRPDPNALRDSLHRLAR